MRLSVVIPSLNERENLKNLIPRVYAAVGSETEVVVMDGPSSDDTIDLVKDLQKNYPTLRYEKQGGVGFANALREALASGAGDVVVSMDAENHDPIEIPKLLAKIEDGADLTIGGRFMPDSEVELARHRLLTTTLANKIAVFLLDLGAKDTSSGFRAYRKTILEKILSEKFCTNYFSVQVELLEKVRRNKGKVAEVGVKYLARVEGDSKFNFKPAILDAKNLLVLGFRKKLGRL